MAVENAQQELEAQKIQAQIMVGDKDPIIVKASNGETYKITRTKTRVGVLASEQLMFMKQTRPFSKRLNQLQEAISALEEGDDKYYELLKEYEDLNQQMISEYINSVGNSEFMCKALALIILNDVNKIEADEFVKPTAFRKFFGAEDKLRADKDRLWYKLHCELDNLDIFNLFVAATKKFSTDVFFYTMGLIQNLNSLKAPSPAEPS